MQIKNSFGLGFMVGRTNSGSAPGATGRGSHKHWVKKGVFQRIGCSDGANGGCLGIYH